MRPIAISPFKLLACCCLIIECVTAAAHADSPSPPLRQPITYALHFQIDPGPLDRELSDFAVQAKFQVLYDPDIVPTMASTPGLTGMFTPEAALSILLSHTNLRSTFVGDRTVSISKGHDSQVVSRTSPAVTTDATWVTAGAEITGIQNERPPQHGDSARNGGGGDLQEVLVTAEKREERLQDVPVPVTAISANLLTESNLSRLQDYFSNVPGLSLNTTGTGDANLAIRGITTGGNTSSTVAITIDDIPVGAASAITYNNAYVPDIDPSDLARIEVLRGPQGTLYGASSIGGLVKYVTVDPSVNVLSGRIEASGNEIHDGSTTGYGVRVAANIPATDTLAFRISSFVRGDPGYLSDPVRDIHGINRTKAYGGRFSALWSPSSALTVKLGALLQDNSQDGLSASDPAFGDLKQSLLPGSGTHTSHVQLYSVNVNAKLGPVDVASVSGYSINKVVSATDFSDYFGSFANGYFGVSGSTLSYTESTKKFSQEIRLSSSLREKIDLLLGGFFTHERNPVDGPLTAADPVTGRIVGELVHYNFPSTFTEIAGFLAVTVHFTDAFDVQLGARESHNRQTYDETDTGPAIEGFFGSPSPLKVPGQRSNDNSFTYLVTPRYKLSPDLMLYARLASGYRPGGPNPDATLFGFPDRFGADKTKNYEMGLKAQMLDRRLSIDTSVYYIKWDNIQIGITDPNSGYGFFENGLSARSQGVEFALQLNPARGLNVYSWFAFGDAKLVGDLPNGAPAVGHSGDRLPYSSRYSGNLSIEEEVPLYADWKGFLRGTVSYVGDRVSDFSSSEESRLKAPGYVSENIIAGLQSDSWDIHIFVNNIGDRRGVVSLFPAFDGRRYIFIQPRTVGVSVAKRL